MIGYEQDMIWEEILLRTKNLWFLIFCKLIQNYTVCLPNLSEKRSAAWDDRRGNGIFNDNGNESSNANGKNWI